MARFSRQMLRIKIQGIKIIKGIRWVFLHHLGWTLSTLWHHWLVQIFLGQLPASGGSWQNSRVWGLQLEYSSLNSSSISLLVKHEPRVEHLVIWQQCPQWIKLYKIWVQDKFSDGSVSRKPDCLLVNHVSVVQELLKGRQGWLGDYRVEYILLTLGSI